MKKLKVFIVVIGLLLMFVGGGLTAYAVVKAQNNPSNLKTETKEIETAFNDLDVEVTEANIILKKSNDAKCTLEFNQTDKYYFESNVENNKLVIKSVDTRKWYEKIFYFNFFNVSVTVNMPEGMITDLKLNSSVGNILIEDNFNFNSMNLESSTGNINIKNNIVTNDINIKASTGNVRLTDTRSKNLTIKTSTGNVHLTNYVASEHMKLEVSTGNIHFDSSDAATIYASTSTGNISGTLKTSKKFNVSVGTGTAHYPQNTDGGECVLKTSTGNINVDVIAE